MARCMHGWPLTKAGESRPQLNSQCDQDDSENKSVRTHPNRQRQRTRERSEKRETSEQQRSEAAEGEEPLAGNQLSQTPRGGDLEDSSHNRPNANENREYDNRDAR